MQPDLADTTLDFSVYDQMYSIVPEDIHILVNISPQGHHYQGYCIPGTWIPIDTLQYTRFVKAVVERYNGDGIDDMPIWITEMGSYSGDPINPFGPDVYPYQAEAQQAGDYLKWFVYPLSQGIEKIFPAFGLMEGFKSDSGYFDFTGLIYDDWGPHDQGLGVKKPGYFTYKKMTEILERSDWENVHTIDTGVENLYCCLYSIASELSQSFQFYNKDLLHNRGEHG